MLALVADAGLASPKTRSFGVTAGPVAKGTLIVGIPHFVRAMAYGP
jgi:hypothetical protein